MSGVAGEKNPAAAPGFWRRGLAKLDPRALLRGAVRRGLDLVYPPQCMACEAATADAHSLCVTCWNGMSLIAAPYCERLGTPFAADYGIGMLSPAAIADPPRFDRGRAVALHKGTARDLVSRLKYAERLDLALMMGRMMAQAGRDILGEADLIVPVSMHRLRLWRRRYNQAALLAEALGRETGIATLPDALERIRRTRAQVGLRRSERQRNLAGAFRLNERHRGRIEGRHVVVIDDVRTTGSTLNASAHILRKAGAARIDVLTFTLVADGEM
jgi:ComF family protein